MQIIEKEISRAESNYFGNLVCLGDDAGNPCFWVKKITTEFLSLEKKELIIALDIYCYDRDFNSTYSKDEIDKINENIKRTYDIFIDDCKNMDDFFLKEFNSEKDEWDIEDVLEGKEDIYEKIKVTRVEILKNQYNIIFMLNNEEWALVKKVNNNHWSLLPSGEARYPEMVF